MSGDQSQERLRAMFTYEDTGTLRRIAFTHPRHAPYPWHLDPRGYFRCDLGSGTSRLSLFRHRAIFIWHHGAIPEGAVIDHINRVRSDDRIENLRLTDRAGNNRNMPVYRNSKTGVTGVVPFRGRYRAIVCVEGRMRHLGLFASIAEAAEVASRIRSALGRRA